MAFTWGIVGACSCKTLQRIVCSLTPTYLCRGYRPDGNNRPPGHHRSALDACISCRCNGIMPFKCLQGLTVAHTCQHLQEPPVRRETAAYKAPQVSFCSFHGPCVGNTARIKVCLTQHTQSDSCSICRGHRADRKHRPSRHHRSAPPAYTVCTCNPSLVRRPKGGMQFDIWLSPQEPQG